MYPPANIWSCSTECCPISFTSKALQCPSVLKDTWAFRVSKKPPTVKMQVLTVGDFVCFRRISNRKAYFSELVKSPCCARHFDLLRKPPSTVPMYADECGLLVLAAPLTSASLSKNKFFDRLYCRSPLDCGSFFKPKRFVFGKDLRRCRLWSKARRGCRTR